MLVEGYSRSLFDHDYAVEWVQPWLGMNAPGQLGSREVDALSE